MRLYSDRFCSDFWKTDRLWCFEMRGVFEVSALSRRRGLTIDDAREVWDFKLGRTAVFVVVMWALRWLVYVCFWQSELTAAWLLLVLRLVDFTAALFDEQIAADHRACLLEAHWSLVDVLDQSDDVLVASWLWLARWWTLEQVAHCDVLVVEGVVYFDFYFLAYFISIARIISIQETQLK